MTLHRVVALAALGLLGCRVGPKVQHFPAANGPAGIAVQLRARAEISGELLAVEDTALLVRESSRGLVRVPFRLIERADFNKVGSAGLGGGRTPQPGQIARLRLVSRFPHGVSPQVLQRLLAANQQADVRPVAE